MERMLECKSMRCETKCAARMFVECDRTITLSLKSLDIAVNGDTEAAAKSALAKSLIEYAGEFWEEFELYSKVSNRREHLPYVIMALTASILENLESTIICQPGEC